jgi:hypothetical protein
VGLSAVAVAGTVACARDPLDEVCTPIATGALVVSELRGPQSGTYGEWIELYNASDQTIPLLGLELRLRRLDGGAEARILVRSAGVTIAADAYATLGAFAIGSEPDHVDYGFAADVDGSIYDSGAIEVYACETLIDTAVYRNLPTSGTWSLGIVPPTAIANDDEASWCVELGIRGTPQEENRPCPAR